MRIALLLLRQFLLPARQLLQLLQRLVDFLLALLGGTGLLAGLVLVLLGIQLQVEQVLQIAAGVPPPPPPPPPRLPKAT